MKLVAKIFGVVTGVILLYALSSGPVYGLATRSQNPNQALLDMVEKAYYPLLRLSGYSVTIDVVYIQYLLWWESRLLETSN